MYFVICSATLETLMRVQDVQSDNAPPNIIKNTRDLYDYNK